MLSPDFNEMEISEFYPGMFIVTFPQDVKVIVDLGCSHLGDAYAFQLFYNKGEERGWTSEKMDITWKFTFAVWNKLTLNNPVLGPHENQVKRRLNDWCRRIQRGYAKCLWDNKTILGA